MDAPLSLPLRALVMAQRWRLGGSAGPVARAVRLRLSREELVAEASIDALRRRLAADNAAIAIEDHGAGTRSPLRRPARRSSRSVSEVYRRAAAKPGWGRLLFALVRELQPARVLELGTNLGVSAAHIASALKLNEGRGRLWTIEGDAGLAERARTNLVDVGVADRVQVVEGTFADVLPELAAAHGPFDMVFLDGHHEERATLAYWRVIRDHLAPGAAVLVDDIEPGRPVRRAWRQIVRDECPAITGYVDLVGLGILFHRGAA